MSENKVEPTDVSESDVSKKPARRSWGLWILGGLVAVLSVLVGTQTIFIFKLLHKTTAESANQTQQLAVNTIPAPTPPASNQSKVIPLNPPANGGSQSKSQSNGSSGTVNQNDPFSQMNPFPGGDPFKQMQKMQEQMQEQMNQMFNQTINGSGSAAPFSFGGNSGNSLGGPSGADIRTIDKGNHYEVRIHIPGVKNGNYQVQVKNQTLTVSGNRTDNIVKRDSKGDVIQRESRTGHFSQSIDLPGPVDPTKMTTKLAAATLLVDIPKQS